MASVQPPQHAAAAPAITPEENLSLDRAASVKSEYLSGRMVAITHSPSGYPGASREHNLITANVLTAINIQIADRPCEVYASDMRVKVEASTDYTYPDVTAVCGEPQFEGSTLDTLVNPVLIVEVLSPSTQDYDRGGKFALYRTIDSLQDYLLIAQDQVRVEHYARQGPFQWLLTEYTNLEDTLALPALGVTLRLSDLYRKVFP